MWNGEADCSYRLPNRRSRAPWRDDRTPRGLLPPSLFAQTSNAYTFRSLFSFLFFFFLCFFFFLTKNQKLSTNTSPSSSPIIKSFPQILFLLLSSSPRIKKTFHKSLSSILGFPLSSLPIVSSINDIFFNQKKCFQKAIITHATRSISYASSRRPTSPSANLSLSQATNKQTNKTTKTTKQQCFVEQKCQFLSSFGY